MNRCPSQLSHGPSPALPGADRVLPALCSLLSASSLCSFTSAFFSFFFCHLCLFTSRLPLSLSTNRLQQRRADVTKGVQDGLAGPLCFMADLHRAFCPLLVAPLLLCPPSVVHTCLDQSGQTGFNNAGQKS